MSQSAARLSAVALRGPRFRGATAHDERRSLALASEQPTEALDGREGWNTVSRALVPSAGLLILGVAFANAFVLPLTQPRMELSAAAALARSSPLWSWTATLSAIVPDSQRTTRDAVVGLTLISLLALVGGVRLTWRRTATPGLVAVIAGTTILAWGAMTFALPTADSDVFSYIADGRVGAAHGANPEIVAPIAFPDDPIAPYTSPEYRGIAGDNKLPLWTDITVLLAGLSPADPTAGLLIYRAFFLAASILNLGLIWLFLKRTRPELIASGLVLYGWNPIVLVTGVSKVDTLMATFALASLVLLTAGRQRTATAALVLSVLVKLITLPLLVVRLGRSLWRRDWGELLAGLGVTILVAAVVYAPFWAGSSELQAHLALLGGSNGPIPSIVRPMVDLAFVVVVLLACRMDDGTPTRSARTWTIVMLFFGALLTTLGLSWYLITLVALTAVAGDGALAGAGLILSAVSFLFDRVERYEIGGIAPVPGWLVYMGIGGIVIVGVGILLARRRRSLVAPG